MFHLRDDNSNNDINNCKSDRFDEVKFAAVLKNDLHSVN